MVIFFFFSGRFWTKDCEYLFFRKYILDNSFYNFTSITLLICFGRYMPDKHQLSVQTKQNSAYVAYCCQVSCCLSVALGKLLVAIVDVFLVCSTWLQSKICVFI